MPEGSQIYVGTAGWSYKDWEGIVYPTQIKKSQHPVEYLARYLDVIEDQHLVLRPYQAGMGQAVVPQSEGGKSAISVHCEAQQGVHAFADRGSRKHIGGDDSRQSEDERLAKDGLDSIAGEDMLGAVLAQFPISFKNTNSNRDYLDGLIEKFKHYPLVVEVRHNSWTNEGTLRYFAEKRVAFCNIDQPRLGKAVGPSEHVTSRLGYVRLHGRNYEQWFDSDSGSDRYNYLYTQPELEKWKRRIDTIAAKAKKTFVIANNHFEGKAAVNALQLKHMLTGTTVSVPDTLLRKYWELGEIATSSK